MPFSTMKAHSGRTQPFYGMSETRRFTPRVPSHEEIARLAYFYWEARGRQHGSADEDWFRAERELSARGY
jgi:hypothetical protein